MKLLSPRAGSLAVVAAAGIVLAQTTTNGAGGGYFISITHPGPTGAYTRTLAGDFNGDAQQDVAYLAGSQLDVLIGPAVYDCLHPQVTSCTDFVVVPGAAQDHILTVSWLGLKEVHWTGSGSLWTTSPRPESGWNGVQLLRSWSKYGEMPHVFGLDWDGTTILWLEPVEGAWVQHSLATASPVDFVDLVPFDMDGDGRPELGAKTASDLVIYDPASPDPLAVHSYGTVTYDAVVRVRHPDLDENGEPTNEREWLAAMGTSTTSGGQFFQTIGQEGVANAISVGPLEVYWMSAGDLDGDGNDDLVSLSHANWDMTWSLNDGGSAPSFQVSNSTGHDSGVNGTANGNRARPAVADLDGDGDGDVAYPIKKTQKMWIRRSEAVDENRMTVEPLITLEYVEEEWLWVGAVTGIGPCVSVHASLGLEKPGKYLDVYAWKRASGNSSANATLIHRHREPVDALGPGDTVLLPAFAVPSAATGTQFDEMIYLTFQLVDAPSSDVAVPPTAAYPPFLIRFHAQGDEDPITGLFTPNELEIRNIVGTTLPFEVITFGGGAASTLDRGGGGGCEVGTGSDDDCVPIGNNNPR